MNSGNQSSLSGLRKIGKAVVSLYEAIGAIAMGLMAVVVIFTVIMRYCFSLNWKELSEFNVTLFAFTTFWALGLNVLRNEHVSITILYDAVPPVVRKVFSILSNIIMLVVDYVFVKYGFIYTAKMGKQISQGMEIPMKYMYGIMPVCGCICMVCIIYKLIESIVRPVSSFRPLGSDGGPLK